MTGVRAQSVVVLGFVLLLLPPLLAAQSPQSPTIPKDNTVTIEDPSGDVQLNVLPRTGAPPQSAGGSDAYDHVDIQRVVFGSETASDFRVSIHVKSLTPSSTTGTYRRVVLFSFGTQYWRIIHGGCGGPQTQQNIACLQSSDSGFGGWRTTRTLEFESRADEKALVFLVSKGDVYTQNRTTPRYGDFLSNMVAFAIHYTAQTQIGPGGDPLGGITATDIAPNAGFAPIFIFTKGSRNQGSLALYSQDPIRVSNGEATTIVYRVELHNVGAKTATVQLDTEGVPAEWSARVPSLLTLEPKTKVQVPVIVGVPFTHEHGVTRTFTITAKAIGDAESVATIDVGVFWTDVPQPSAHHQGKQWFHSAPSDNPQLPSQLEFLIPQKRIWMNGIEKDPDPQADDANAPAVYNQGFPGGGGMGAGNSFIAQWFFPLSPPLLIGLDFDLSRPNQMAFDLVPKLPATTATVTTRLHYCDPSAVPQSGPGGGGGGGANPAFCTAQRPIIAEGGRTASLSANVPVRFEIPMVTRPEYDLIPYRHGANIGLSVTLQTNVPQNTLGTEPRPEFAIKSAGLELALFEYHDPVEQAFQEAGLLHLRSSSDTEKLLNPGRTALFHFLLASDAGDVQESVSLEIQGVNRGWARILGGTEFKLEPGEERNVSVAVVAPADGVDDERADLFLRAENLEDPSIVTFVRFRATITTNDTIPDEADNATAASRSGSTPAPGVMVVPAGLAMTAWITLRRRREEP